MKTRVVIAALLVAAGSAVSIPGPHPRAEAGTSPTGTRPNILVIVTDDQRLDTMDVMSKTRRIFGDQGVTYSNGFASTPLCCPFRASLMTGQYAHNSGIQTQVDSTKLRQKQTIQSYLHRAGYKTALAGKFLNHWPTDGPPKFFDRWASMHTPVTRGGYYSADYNIDGTRRTVRRYNSDFLGSISRRFLNSFESADQRPWFLYLTPYAPHSPAQPALRHARAGVAEWEGTPGTAEEDLTDKPKILYPAGYRPMGPKSEIATRQRRALLGADDLVETVFARLEELGEADNTLAFFMSDNGYLLGEHGLKEKRYPYMESVRVPFYVRWPGRLTEGSNESRLVSNIDVLPTVLEAARVSPRTRHVLDGKSLLSSTPRERFLIEHFGDGYRHPPSWASLVTPTSQYTEYYDRTLSNVTDREFYDLVADPYQLNNQLAGAGSLTANQQTELANSLAADRTCAGATCP